MFDQSTIYADAKTFQQVMEWMDKAANSTEIAGMKRILQAEAPWYSD